jgi:hypothetical protein
LQPALATQERLTDYRSVNVFLSSILRNSQRSKYAYQYGLVHFQKFIVLKYPQYDIETILKPLSKNKLNIYTILDEFVPYLVHTTLKLTSSSVKLCIAAVRFYLAYYDIDVIPQNLEER